MATTRILVSCCDIFLVVLVVLFFLCGPVADGAASINPLSNSSFAHFRNSKFMFLFFLCYSLKKRQRKNGHALTTATMFAYFDTYFVPSFPCFYQSFGLLGSRQRYLLVGTSRLH